MCVFRTCYFHSPERRHKNSPQIQKKMRRFHMQCLPLIHLFIIHPSYCNLTSATGAAFPLRHVQHVSPKEDMESVERAGLFPATSKHCKANSNLKRRAKKGKRKLSGERFSYT